MMDFARSLAPLRDSDVTRAVPVLPSRFGGEAPLQLAPTQPFEDEAQADTATPASARARVAARPPSSVSVSQPHQPAMSLQVAQSETLARRRESASSPVHLIPADAAIAVPTLPRRTARALVPPGRGEDDAVTASVPMNVDHSSSADSLPAPPAAARNDAALRHPPQRPMSEPALAARHIATAEPRPVVHVTIDRIDVRAPAAPPRPAPATRSRNTAPSVSLADYLRQGTSKTGGAR